MALVTFTGVSGWVYSYAISIPPWRDVPANYLFARQNNGIWSVAYIGQCQSAQNRLSCHERWNEAVRTYGAMDILTHESSPVCEVREAEERDLIAAFRPPMNVQHQPGPSPFGPLLGGDWFRKTG